MPDPQAADLPAKVSAQPGSSSIHGDFINNSLPEWLIKASAQRRMQLKLNDFEHLLWFQALTLQQRTTLKAYTQTSLQSQQVVDERLAGLQSVEVFAKALLSQALKDQFKVELDVEHTFIYLDKTLTLGVLGIEAGAFNVLKVSLLHGALHNFEADEAESDAFDPVSGFITQDAKPVSTSLTVPQFITLCRSLDIGAHYQTYLKGFLHPEDEATLREAVIASQKDALKAAAYLALVRKDIEPADYTMVLDVIAGERNPTLGGKPVWFCALSVMGLKLKGCVVFEPVEKYRYGDASIVYVPHDPEHPLKRYNTFADLKTELTRQLLAPDADQAAFTDGPNPTRYQRFFSQFVDGARRPYYFSRFTQPVSSSQSNLNAVVRSPIFQSVFEFAAPLLTALLKPQELPPEKASARETAQAPDLKPMVVARYGLWSPNVDLWADLYESNRDKIIADARHQAVPTADVDARVRAQKIAHLWEGGFAVVGLVSMFVPVLGEIMLAVMVEQLLAETFEGVMDWSQGDREAARQHLIDVAQNLALMALMAGAGKGLAKLPSVQTPAVIDGLKPVTLPGGERRLWKPDLAPYRSNVSLPAESTPNELGLYRHDGQDILPLDGGHYVVEEDPASGRHRIPHPTRPEGYSVPLEHNGAGLWTHGGEEPMAWDGPALMRRLGFRAQGLSDAQLERVRMASGTDYDALRRVYVEQDRPSALLDDTLARFRIEHDLEVFARQISSADPQEFGRADLRLQFKVMRSQGLLPPKPAIRVVDAQGRLIWEDAVTPDAPSRRLTVVITEDTRVNGTLLPALLNVLKSERIDLRNVPGAPDLTVAQRAIELRKAIAADARHNRLMLFESLYDARPASPDPMVKRVQSRYRHLPDAVVEQLLEAATEQDLEALGRPGPLPPRIDELAQWCQQELRLARAYEGLHLDISASVDSERLALRSLETLPGWPAQARFELREGGSQGRLVDTLGAPQSPLRAALVFNEACGFGQEGTSSLYTAVLAALTTGERQVLGFSLENAEGLKQAVQQAPLPRDEFRAVLQGQRVLRPGLEPGSRLLGGMPLRQQLASIFRTRRGRVLKLYPDFTEAEADTFLQSLGDTAGSELTRLEAEHLSLKQALFVWAKEPLTADGTPDQINIARRRAVAQTINRSWQRQSGSMLSLERVRDLPPLNASFNHVQELVITSSSFDGSADAFLKNFTRLRRLRLKSLSVSRIPETVAQMPDLVDLDLSGCMIRLDERGVAILERMNTLQTLDLQNNLLGRLPDFSTLTGLQRLNLRATDINQWPVGLRDLTGLRLVDLRDNQLREVPSAIHNPAPEHLEAQARANRVTLLRGNRLSYDDFQHLKAYRERLAQTRPELLVGGLDGAFAIADPLAARARALYPDFTDDQIQALLQPLDQAEAKLTGLERELEVLNSQLSSWAFSGGGESQGYVRVNRVAQATANRGDRYQAMERIRRCWRRETPQMRANDGTPIGLELNLSGLTLPSLPDLDADFSHVGALNLSRMNLSASPEGFLRRYQRVRWLDLSRNQLTELPPALADMHGLTRLHLQYNRIRLTPETARILSERTTLRSLVLTDNPLGISPDFTRISDIRSLFLNNTQLETWPVGLADQPLVDRIDLTGNRITTIAQEVVAPAAEHLVQRARLNNVTFLGGNPLSDVAQQQLVDYWARLEREQPVLVRERSRYAFEYQPIEDEPPTHVRAGAGSLNPQARTELQRWVRDLSAVDMATRQSQWSGLAAQEGAAGFFRVLNDLEEAGAAHGDMQRRVWAVIDSITEDTPKSAALREQMFEWAGRPACCDRAALSFSNLEIMSLVYRAETQAGEGQRAAALLKLARGLFRLDHVERIALADIERRTAAIHHTPGLTSLEKAARIERLEDVEIRLAYRYGLKDRLALPAQPSQVRFTRMADVSQQTLDQVYTSIVSMNNSPAEFHALLARDFWKDYVTNTYRAQFEAQRAPFEERQASLHQRFESGALTQEAYTQQSDDLEGQLQIEEAGLIERLSRQLLAEHPL